MQLLSHQHIARLVFSIYPDNEQLSPAGCRATGFRIPLKSPAFTLDPYQVSNTYKLGQTPPLVAPQWFSHLFFTLQPNHGSEAATALACSYISLPPTVFCSVPSTLTVLLHLKITAGSPCWYCSVALFLNYSVSMSTETLPGLPRALLSCFSFSS